MAKGNYAYQKKDADTFDIWTFLTVLGLIVIGLISIYSATYESKMSSFFWKQIAATGIGLGGLFSTMYLSKRWLKTISIYVYGISLLLLVLVLFFGVEIYGTRGWLRIGGFSLQPAEFAKLGIIMAIGLFLSSKGKDVRNIRDFAIVFLLSAVPMFLVFRQPDIGTLTVLMALFIGILLWSGFNSLIIYGIVFSPFIIVLSLQGGTVFYVVLSSLIVGSLFFRTKIYLKALVIAVFISVSFAGPMVYDNMMDHQKARIDSFLDPESDPRGKGYNVRQSLMAVGSGGVYGKGFLQGTQTQLRYIPMQWTDFIFSVPTEEFGFIGGVVVIILFTVLIIRFIRIASETDSKFYSIIAIGTASVFLYHYFINVGMAIGIIPVMGIPLPFMSSGGTSMIVNLTLVGLVMNAYRENKKHRSTYERVSLYE